jgi:hypothetical protein
LHLLQNMATLALAAECAGKTVAQCADALAKTVDELQQENLTLTQKLDAQATTFNNTVGGLAARISVLEGQIKSISQNLLTGNQAATVYIPAAGQPPFGGTQNPGTAGPPNSGLLCQAGYYVVGLYVDRTGNGLDDARVVCQPLNTALK